MAILSKIRERTVFLIIIIALALFSFVLADVINQGGFSDEKGATFIGSVNGDEINKESFSRQVENYNRQMGGSSMRNLNLVWESNVNRLILKQEFEKLGLQASSEQILDFMVEQFAGDPRFQDENGSFSEARLGEYIANLKATSTQEYAAWKEFEKNVEVEVLTNMYFNMVKAGVGATLFEARQKYMRENDNLAIEFIQVPFEAVGDVEVSKNEIKKYTEENKAQFKQEATADFQYIFFEEIASTEDETNIQQELEELKKDFTETDDVAAFLVNNSENQYQDIFRFEYDFDPSFGPEIFNLNKGEVYGSYKERNSWKQSKLVEYSMKVDSAQVAHILVTFEGGQIDPNETRSKEEAKKLADSLLGVIKKEASKYTTLAEEFSADKQSATKGGDLGKLKYGSFFEKFNEFVFETTNSLGVVESDFGYHIVKVDERTSPKKAAKVATISLPIRPSEKTLDKIYEEANTFAYDVQGGDYLALAEEKDYEIKPVNAVKMLEENIPGLGKQRNIVKWAFENDTKIGDTKIFDINNGFVVAQLVGKKPEGIQSIEDASAKVIPIIKQQKQAEKIISQIKSNDLEAVASQFDVTKRTASSVSLDSPLLPGVGQEPGVVGAAFALNEGSISAPIVGAKGVFLVKLTRRTEAAKLPSYSSLAKEETENRTKNISGQSSILTKALREAADMVDNRSDFY